MATIRCSGAQRGHLRDVVRRVSLREDAAQTNRRVWLQGAGRLALQSECQDSGERPASNRSTTCTSRRWTQSGGWEVEIRVHHPHQDTWYDVRLFVERDRSVQKCGVLFERPGESPAGVDIESVVDRINSPTLIGKFILLKGTDRKSVV